MVRALVQKEITEKIDKIVSEYVEDFFKPAVENVKRNHPDVNAEMLLEDVCLNAIEHSKSKYRKTPLQVIKNEYGFVIDKGTVVIPNPSLTIEPTVLTSSRPLKRKTDANEDTVVACKKLPSSPVQKPALKTAGSGGSSDLILITKQGKPVRREGHEWDPSRLTADTMFILGSKANKALGLGQTRGRLYMKHPELFKYSGDQDDKEWLTKNQIMSTTGGKAYLMVLQDIVNLSLTDEYAKHPRQKPDELVGFKIPLFMLEKMQNFMRQVQTDPNATDEVLLAEARQQLARIDQKKVTTKVKKTPTTAVASSAPFIPVNSDLELADIDDVIEDDSKDDCEIVTANVTVGEDDLGSFLHGMNLNSLVREFENASSDGMASQHLDGILSLADDEDHEAPFPELTDEDRNGQSEPTKNLEFD